MANTITPAQLIADYLCNVRDDTGSNDFYNELDNSVDLLLSIWHPENYEGEPEFDVADALAHMPALEFLRLVRSVLP